MHQPGRGWQVGWGGWRWWGPGGHNGAQYGLRRKLSDDVEAAAEGCRGGGGGDRAEAGSPQQLRVGCCSAHGGWCALTPSPCLLSRFLPSRPASRHRAPPGTCWRTPPARCRWTSAPRRPPRASTQVRAAQLGAAQRQNLGWWVGGRQMGCGGLVAHGHAASVSISFQRPSLPFCCTKQSHRSLTLQLSLRTKSIITENCVVIAEGALGHDGAFHVRALGLPPCEPRASLPLAAQRLNLWGGPGGAVDPASEVRRPGPVGAAAEGRDPLSPGSCIDTSLLVTSGFTTTKCDW